MGWFKKSDYKSEPRDIILPASKSFELTLKNAPKDKYINIHKAGLTEDELDALMLKKIGKRIDIAIKAGDDYIQWKDFNVVNNKAQETLIFKGCSQRVIEFLISMGYYFRDGIINNNGKKDYEVKDIYLSWLQS